MVNSINTIMYNLELLNKRNSSVTYGLSSGEALQNGSDDSKRFNSILSIKNSINSYTNIETNITNISSYNSLSDNNVSSIKTSMESINSEILTALNDTVSSDEKEVIATQIESLKETMYNLLNGSTESNIYLFSGDDKSTQPFIKDETTGKISYVASFDSRTVNVEENYYVNAGVTGLDLMYYTSNSASNGSDITFTENDIILDKDNNQYKMLDIDNDGTFDGLYLNGDNTNTPLTITQNSDGTYSATNTISSTLNVKHSYFDDLDELISALKLQDTNGNTISDEDADSLLTSALNKFQSAYDNLNTNHSKLGSRTNVINNYEEIVQSKLTHFTVLQEEYASADLTALAVESQALENTYTALYSAINRINSLSLVNYLS